MRGRRSGCCSGADRPGRMEPGAGRCTARRINRLTPLCQAGLNQPAPNKRHPPNGKSRSDVVLKVREGPSRPERLLQRTSAHASTGRAATKTRPDRRRRGRVSTRSPGETCWTESPRMAPGYSQDGAGVAGGQGSLCRDLLTQHLRSPQQQD